MHELGTKGRGFTVIHLLCIQLDDILLENQRENCIRGKGEILDRDSNVRRSTKQLV
jgi:hypothetical protein